MFVLLEQHSFVSAPKVVRKSEKCSRQDYALKIFWQVFRAKNNENLANNFSKWTSENEKTACTRIRIRKLRKRIYDCICSYCSVATNTCGKLDVRNTRRKYHERAESALILRWNSWRNGVWGVGVTEGLSYRQQSITSLHLSHPEHNRNEK